MYTLDISGEVQAALENNKPIVALESTIITHGMPWPQNYHMANQVEDMVRAHGATSATIAVIEGRIKIGLDQSALKTLAQTQGARKLSRADLAVCLVDEATGATTVAATSYGDCGRCQSDFGYSQNARGVGNIGRAGHRLWSK